MKGEDSRKSDSHRSPILKVSRIEAEDTLAKRIDFGNQILSRQISNYDDLHQSEAEYRKWDDYNKELLRGMFDSLELANEYDRQSNYFSVTGTFDANLNTHNTTVREKISRLESVKGRLPLYQELITRQDTTSIGSNKNISPNSKMVFIVHGTNEVYKDQLARFLEKLELNVIILHERPNKGQTIMEKLEDYSSVSFAIILITADDVGRPVIGSGDLLHRARQNVIFELGYFIGKLGRERVCALYEKGTELPSDFNGVVYIPIENNTWKLQIAREIQAAGMNIDLNKAI